MRNMSFGKKFFLIIGVLFLVLIAYRLIAGRDDQAARMVSKNEILHLEINGVILNGKKFLERLKKYSKDKSVKAIVIDINSPGGAVGPSQEIYYEIIRAKKETKKPVICVSTGLMASGGYYAGLACDQILVAPGTMIGSIGVIMQFANIQGLYDWAKVQRYSITSGKFKDSGAEYRPMREDERELFQNMITEVYQQFRDAVVDSRNLPLETVTQYADGRVMTGATAVKLKFADVEGTFEDAIRMAAQKAKLGDDYHVFKPGKKKDSFFQMLFDREDDDDLNSLEGVSQLNQTLRSSASAGSNKILSEAIKTVFQTKLLNQPLYLMPGTWEY